MNPLNPRFVWLTLYIIANVAAVLIMSNTGVLIGDAEGVTLYSESALIIAFILVVLSYLLILWPVFNFITRIKATETKLGIYGAVVGNRIGKILIVLQIAFMAFNVATGANVAGANSVRPNTALSIIWVLIPVDPIFLIYYAKFRTEKLFYPNLLIWLISNIMRGWAGVFMFVLFLEWGRAVRLKKISFRMAAIVGVIVLVSYPVITNFKWIIRASAGTDIQVGRVVGELTKSLSAQDYLSLVSDGVNHVIGRLQVTSNVVEDMRLQDILQSDFAASKFTPFWMEGLQGIVFNRLFTGKDYLPVGVAFTKYENYNFQFDVGDWNTNIGYVGWFFIAPYLIPVYIIFTISLGFISSYMTKKIGASEMLMDLLWFSWLVYLMPPWLNTFVNFIYALCVFFSIQYLASIMPPIIFIKRCGLSDSTNK